MPPVSEPPFNEEDTPDEVRAPKTPSAARKKKGKKASKLKAADECKDKDSSSEEPKPSPDLFVASLSLSHHSSCPTNLPPRPAIVDHTNPSPPPSPCPEPAANCFPNLDLLGQLDVPPDKPPLVNSIVIPSEPSPPQDGVLTPQHVLKPSARLPIAVGVAQHVPSLSSSPQGGIRLPPAASHARNYSASPSNHSSLSPRGRKPSLASPPARNHPFHDASAPHLPQRHYMRRPEMDFGLAKNREGSVTAGSRGYYCGFDTLEKSNAGASAAANNVILTGNQGGLDVYRLLRQRADVVGRLEGLRGAVVDAKILPWTDRCDPYASLRPLVLCVIHGPVLPPRQDDSRQDTHSHEIPYQTTVEVFSLATSQSLGTLFESPKVPTARPIAHELFTPPPPIGNIRIAAEGRFVTVASGTSGEVYVFSPYTQSADTECPPFRCIAKLWTSVKPRPSASAGTTTQENQPAESDPEQRDPIIALSERWLAIKPPHLSSSQVSLQGTALLSATNPDPPGASSYVSPPPPALSCDVDAPYSNSLLDRVTKQATVEIRKGAQWVGEQGKHVWKAYWNRSSPSQATNVPQGPQNTSQTDTGLFPPTHATHDEPPKSPVEPALISIVDLYRLLEFEENPTKGALTPLSTFSLPDGCSYLSFAPGGLSLLVTNHLGDASTIWDLSRISSWKLITADALAANGPPLVSMTARFARQTPSVVADVAWSSHGTRLAILTQKGTVHLHELPSASFRTLLSARAGSQVCAVTPSPGSSPQGDASLTGFMSNVRARFQSLPGVAFRPPVTTNALGTTVTHASAYARHAGSKAFRQGVTLATDAALKIRHHEENKIRLHHLHSSAAPARLRWLGGRDSGILATFTDGKVRLYTVKTTTYAQGKRTAVSLMASRRPIFEVGLRSISGDVLPPAVLGFLNPSGPHAACARDQVHGFWALNKSNIVRRSPPGRTRCFSAAVVQDKDTNPTYLPFHRFPQVSLFTFDETTREDAMPSNETWVFGLPMPSTTKITCHQIDLDEKRHSHDDADMQGFVDDLNDTFHDRLGLQAPFPEHMMGDDEFNT